MSSGTSTDQELPIHASGSVVESAPSYLTDSDPTIARWLGGIGWTMALCGGMVVLLTLISGPRLVPSSVGYGFLFIGLLLMLFHAARDGDVQIRRYYGYLGLAWIAAALLFALLPGGATSAPTKYIGYYFLPHGAGCLVIGLAFLMAFAVQERDEKFRDMILLPEFVVGVLLALVCFIGGIFRPDFLLGYGVVLGLTGVAYLCSFVAQKGSTVGVGHQVGLLIGLIGAIFVLYGLGRSIVPALATPDRSRMMFVGGGLSLVIGVVGRVLLSRGGEPLSAEAKSWRGVASGMGLLGVVALAIGGLGAARVFAGTSLSAYFIPYGITLISIGVVYLILSVGICSDSQFVVLTRKEFTGYFYSPVAYLVLFGVVVAFWFNYAPFVDSLEAMVMTQFGRQQIPVPEPIVARYIYTLVPVMVVSFMVPAVTMRLLSEEQRTGTLEVLFTAPVREWTAVLSKFAAGWMFFMLLWLPWALYLVALRVAGETPFDYRPLLGFFVALGATGAAFVAMGLMFSSLTKNQIVAAVLTFCGMVMFLLFRFTDDMESVQNIALGAIFRRLSYLTLWRDSLSGQLALSDLALHLSLAGFFLYLTVKVLESRRWK